MSLEEYINTMRREFAFYGFTTCPLTEGDLRILFRRGYSTGDAYGIGCDVNAGFDFDHAILVNLED